MQTVCVNKWLYQRAQFVLSEYLYAGNMSMFKVFIGETQTKKS